MEKVYSFTNENVSSYSDIYNMNGANMLTILGSGDQYFTAILNGAKNVELIDINVISWYYFVLKFTSIKYLSYEEFIKFFITEKINNNVVYAKIRNYLPNDIRNFFDKMVIIKSSFSNILSSSGMTELFSEDDYKRYIPYLEENQYYKLQETLRSIELPVFSHQDFQYFINENNKKQYDIVMLSNIYHWMNMEPLDFKRLLDKANCDVIQALYSWNYGTLMAEFKTLGFEITGVPPVVKNEFIEENYALMGTHTRKCYRLGDPVRIEVFQVNIAERNIDFILAGEDESVRERIKMQLSEQRKSVSYRSDVPDKKGKKKKGGKDKFAKRGKGGIGGNKYLKDSKNKHGKRKKKQRNK